jgi:hypothetical protein
MSVTKLFRRALAAALISLLVAAAAFAAKPLKGKSYFGKVTSSPTDTLSFAVSKNGKRVTKLNVPLAIRCQSGFGGIKTKAPKKTKITKNGTFKAVVKAVSVTGKKSFGKETVTGKFLKGGKERGKISGKQLKFGAGCKGTTLKYTAVAGTLVAPKPI